MKVLREKDSPLFKKLDLRLQLVADGNSWQHVESNMADGAVSCHDLLCLRFFQLMLLEQITENEYRWCYYWNKAIADGICGLHVGFA